MTKAKSSKKLSKNNKVINDGSVEVTDMEVDVPSQTIKIIGFDTDEDILNEINSRMEMLNQNTFMLKNIPKKMTRTTLQERIPEMITCRFPKSKTNFNNGYAFIQMKNEAMMEKYINDMNNSKIDGVQLSATKVKASKPFTDIKFFDLKTLYFNGLHKKTKMSDLKEAYPNAKIFFPTLKDNSAEGSVTLTFTSEEDAKQAFVENKSTIEGVKLQLVYALKEGIKAAEEAKIAEEAKRLEEEAKKAAVVNKVPVVVKETAGKGKLKRKLDEDDVDTNVTKKVRVEKTVASRVPVKRRQEDERPSPAKKAQKSALPTRVVAKAKKPEAEKVQPQKADNIKPAGKSVKAPTKTEKAPVKAKMEKAPVKAKEFKKGKKSE